MQEQKQAQKQWAKYASPAMKAWLEKDPRYPTTPDVGWWQLKVTPDGVQHGTHADNEDMPGFPTGETCAVCELDAGKTVGMNFWLNWVSVGHRNEPRESTKTEDAATSARIAGEFAAVEFANALSETSDAWEERRLALPEGHDYKGSVGWAGYWSQDESGGAHRFIFDVPVVGPVWVGLHTNLELGPPAISIKPDNPIPVEKRAKVLCWLLRKWLGMPALKKNVATLVEVIDAPAAGHLYFVTPTMYRLYVDDDKNYEGVMAGYDAEDCVGEFHYPKKEVPAENISRLVQTILRDYRSVEFTITSIFGDRSGVDGWMRHVDEANSYIMDLDLSPRATHDPRLIIYPRKLLTSGDRLELVRLIAGLLDSAVQKRTGWSQLF